MADNSNATGSPAPADATGTADAAAAVGAADVAVDIGAATPTDADTGLTTNPTAAASPPAAGGEAGGDDASAPAPAADASSPAPAPSSGAGGDAPANGAETAGTAGTTPAPVTQAAAPAPATDNGATKEASGSETKAEPAHAGGHGGDALRASHGVSEDIASRRRAASEQAKMMMSHRKRPSNGRYSLSYGFTQYSKVPAVVLAVGIATFLVRGDTPRSPCRTGRLASRAHLIVSRSCLCVCVCVCVCVAVCGCVCLWLYPCIHRRWELAGGSIVVTPGAGRG